MPQASHSQARNKQLAGVLAKGEQPLCMIKEVKTHFCWYKEELPTFPDFLPAPQWLCLLPYKFLSPLLFSTRIKELCIPFNILLHITEQLHGSFQTQCHDACIQGSLTCLIFYKFSFHLPNQIQTMPSHWKSKKSFWLSRANWWLTEAEDKKVLSQTRKPPLNCYAMF